MNDIINEEKEYLEYTKNCLEKEIEYYKKEMKEIPKRYTNVLQGDAFLVQDLLTTIGTKLRRLEFSEKKPYFGRIDFLPDNSNNDTKIYIGKTTIQDSSNTIVTTDWRSPICSLYYDSNIGRTKYNSPSGEINGQLKLKRQILIDDGKIIDVMDTNIVSNDELLQPYLSVNADNKMKTIIASIQNEQNSIIRKPLNKNIIVQGVAGSGKTSVALHRIAYLVYNYEKETKSNNFLVIGPNKYFLNYISGILPELETDPVNQETYIDIVNDLSKEKLTLDTKNTLYNQKHNIEEYKKIQKLKSSMEYKKTLDIFLKEYWSKGIVQDAFQIDGEIIYDIEEIKSVLFAGQKKIPNYEKACKYFINDFKNNIDNIYFYLNQKYKNIYTNIKDKDDPIRKEAVIKSAELDKLIRNDGTKLIKEFFKKLDLGILNIYKLFILNINDYITGLNENEIKKLQEDTLSSLKKKKVAFEDLPALLHINNIIKGVNVNASHIVIDEAQDYGLFHFDAIKEAFPNSYFSIYGDLAQSIYSYRSIHDWESVSSIIFNDNCEILNLNKSYRTTIEITTNANKVLSQLNLNNAEPVIRHGNEIVFNDAAKNIDYKIKKIYEWLEKGYKTIAIICKTENEAENLYNSLKNVGLDIKHIGLSDTDYKGGVFTITSAASKGLEFDAVMINDASSKVYDSNNENDMHLLYVALTRALHELDILYDRKLCDVLNFNKKIDNPKKLTKIKKSI